MSIIPVSGGRRRGSNRNHDDPFAFCVWDTFDAVRDHILSSRDMWQPFSDFPFRPVFSDHWDDFFLESDFAPINSRIDWTETREAHVFRGYFPGLGRDDLVIEVSADRLVKISGGNLSSSFQLPDNVRLDLVSTSMSGGHLIVIVPKEEEPRRPSSVRVVEIEG